MCGCGDGCTGFFTAGLSGVHKKKMVSVPPSCRGVLLCYRKSHQGRGRVIAIGYTLCSAGCRGRRYAIVRASRNGRARLCSGQLACSVNSPVGSITCSAFTGPPLTLEVVRFCSVLHGCLPGVKKRDHPSSHGSRKEKRLQEEVAAGRGGRAVAAPEYARDSAIGHSVPAVPRLRPTVPTE